MFRCGIAGVAADDDNTDLHAEPGFDLFDQRTESRKPVEIPLGDDRILVLDSD